jgi:hypothetical protein
MDYAQEDVARFSVLFFEIPLDHAIERFFPSLVVRTQETRRLGNGQAMVVFIENVERWQRLGHSSPRA